MVLTVFGFWFSCFLHGLSYCLICAAVLSVGDVLRNERDTPGSKYGELIARNMEEGRIGPMEVTVHLLNGAINATRQNENIHVYLIDGAPQAFVQSGTPRRALTIYICARVPTEDGPTTALRKHSITSRLCLVSE